MASDADPYKQYRRAEQVGQDVEEYKWPEHPHAIGADNPASVADRIRELQDVTKHMGGLWRATAVPGTNGIDDTADIIKLFSSTADALGDAFANVWVPPGIPTEVDDLGIAVTLPSGEVAFLRFAALIEASESQSRSISGSAVPPIVPGGGAAALMISASADMPANDTFYLCWYRDADGSSHLNLLCKRPIGTWIEQGDIGFLGIDGNDDNIFIPANMREAYVMPLIMQRRTSHPGTPRPGQLWWRDDL